MIYRGCLSGIVNLVKIMLVRGMGMWDLSITLRISIAKVLKVLKLTNTRWKSTNPAASAKLDPQFGVCLHGAVKEDLPLSRKSRKSKKRKEKRGQRPQISRNELLKWFKFCVI
jgi:hypothetical protein